MVGIKTHILHFISDGEHYTWHLTGGAKFKRKGMLYNTTAVHKSTCTSLLITLVERDEVGMPCGFWSAGKGTESGCPATFASGSSYICMLKVQLHLHGEGPACTKDTAKMRNWGKAKLGFVQILIILILVKKSLFHDNSV